MVFCGRRLLPLGIYFPGHSTFSVLAYHHYSLAFWLGGRQGVSTHILHARKLIIYGPKQTGILFFHIPFYSFQHGMANTSFFLRSGSKGGGIMKEGGNHGRVNLLFIASSIIPSLYFCFVGLYSRQLLTSSGLAHISLMVNVICYQGCTPFMEFARRIKVFVARTGGWEKYRTTARRIWF